MRVLLVEDEAKIVGEVRDGLQRAGYVVETSSDGEDAWFRGETEDFDAIVLDLGLPRLDGLSVARRLRRAGVATPILMLTARGSWMERVEGIDAGADDYLPKPFHPKSWSHASAPSCGGASGIRPTCSRPAPSASIRGG